MQIRIDLDRCESDCRCYDVAREVFEPDDEGHVALIDTGGEVAPDHGAAAATAVRNGPERARSLDLSMRGESWHQRHPGCAVEFSTVVATGSIRRE